MTLEPPQGMSHPVTALVAFAEPIVRGRRVAVLGDATIDLAEALVDRGARLVHVYDPDPGRVAEAMARTVTHDAGRPVVARLTDDLGVRDGAFDVVLVPDITLLGDVASVVRTARRLVSAAGAAVFASPNPESERFLLPPSEGIAAAPGYYELYDAVSLQFPEVRMIGQAPFVGYALVDFSEPDPEVSVDTSVLQEPEVPEWYVAIGSECRVDVDAYSLVEIPLADVARATVSEPVTLPYVGDQRERDLELTELRTRLAVLASENEKLREQAADAQRTARALAEAEQRAAEAERNLEHARRKVGDAQAATTRAEARANTAEQEVARVGQDLVAARSRIRELEAQLATLDPPTLRSKSKEEELQRLAALGARIDGLERRVVELDSELDASNAERGRLQAQADALRTELAAAASRAADDPGADLAELEERLRERGQEITRLKRELREAERVGKELLFELEELRARPGSGGPLAGGGGVAPFGGSSAGPEAGRGALASGDVAPDAGAADAAHRELAERAARSEADLVAASWRIAQLEREAALAAQPADATERERELELALVVAQREIADLRAAAPASSPQPPIGVEQARALDRP